jgi:hypothetical protein
MPISGISQGLGIGGGTSATSSGAPGGGGGGGGGGGFNIDVQDTRANIIARSGDAVGVIAFVTTGANQYDIMVYDGTFWQIYYNN